MIGKMVWWSYPPWKKRAFGKNTLYILKNLQNVMDVEVFVVSARGHTGKPTDYKGINVLPTTEKAGLDTVRTLYNKTSVNLVVQHFNRFSVNISESLDLPIVSYSPVWYKPLSRLEETTCKIAEKIVAPSKFSKQVIEDSGYDCEYIPYGVNTLRYAPISDAREKIGFKERKFTFGHVAKNVMNMENILNQLLAYRKFIDEIDHPENTHYFLVTHPEVENPSGTGMPIMDFIKVLGLSDYVTVLRPTLEEKEMSLFYNSMDVVMNATRGEGFGLCIAEALATETPVIAGDYSAMPELIGEDEERGWLVESVDKTLNRTALTWEHLPNTDGITEKMLRAYRNRSSVKEKGRRGRPFIVNNYNIFDVVEDYWKPLISEELEKYEPEVIS